MRMMLIAALAATAAPMALAAQTVRSADARPVARPSVARPDGHWNNGRRWGYRFNNRWVGGWRAPGGWAAYRPPVRGWVTPRYWVAPSFYIDDFGAYGLAAPAPGYRWYRYYDDAVMVDPYGRVHDSVRGVDWNPGGDAYADVDRDYASGDYQWADAVPPPVAREDMGGAVAGRGDRLPGASTGGGVGAVAGAAIDRAEDARRAPPPHPHADGRGAPYPPPPAYAEDSMPFYAPPVEEVRPLRRSDQQAYADRGYDPAYVDAVRTSRQIRTVRHDDGSITTYHPPGTAVTARGGYIADGWYYPPVTTTTITVSRPVTRTLVTEEVLPVRRAVRRR